MNKDRINGVVKQAVGNIKKATGEIIGDARLVTEGQEEIVAGKVQNAVGSAADAIKDAVKK
jgi:uncharacterized protein YjbJ (UPF0337 family)